MSHRLRSFAPTAVGCCLAAAAIAACSGTVPPIDFGSDGTSESVAGKPSSGGTGTGGTSAGSTGGTGGTGGTGTAGHSATTGGTTGAGGTSATGGTGGSTGGTFGAGGSAGMSVGTGGTVASGGSSGRGATGGTAGRMGTGAGGRSSVGTGGTSTAGSSTGGGAGSSGGDPCATTTVPSGGMQHSSNNASGTAAGLNWTIWSNGSGGSITTYATPAFSAAWNNSGDFLARIGLQWNQTKTYDQYGTITAQYSSKKTGSGGGYSYIGIYGWSVSPCIEWYIVDDSYNKMPVNPGNTTNKGTAMIDGGTYTLYTRATSGTGGSKCPGTSQWTQFYSVRQAARQCGVISISQHFDAWAKAGMTLGKMDQAQILVEVGGGSGSIDFAVANVTTTM